MAPYDTDVIDGEDAYKKDTDAVQEMINKYLPDFKGTNGERT